mmetsp:Transcript_7203/g.17614  ORF Transcript_7203/g.17614 Transcript_7203/m.17614 type:complete len:105 (-) Transcript_7203:253-567(-)
MVSQSKILTCFVFLIAALSAGAAKITTKEELQKDREKHTVHLEHAMAMVKKQLNDHNSGVKVLDDRRVNSLKNRLQSYKGQIYDASRTLSDEEIEAELDKHAEL